MAKLTLSDSKLALKVISRLSKLPGIVDFLRPVDHVELGLTDYLEVVKKPMDLSTVRKKVKAGKYQTMEECLADLQLIWDNCRLYNMHDSLIVHNANRFERFMKVYLASHRPEQKGVEDNGLVSFEDQLELSEKVKKLDAPSLQELVKLVTYHCPQAIASHAHEHLRIRVDAIDGSTYWKLKRLVNRCN